ncbi:MAG: MBL fold metallo-hydrolase [Betaproteobacteria bacterium]|nr:MBL fold metallo-hydrolase [Betaproteobacteria bacterium]
MQEIVPDVFTWSWFSEPHGYNFNGHFVRHPAGNLCIDPVQPPAADLDEIVAAGVATILLTNRNHARAANILRSRTGARTLIHRDDAAHARDRGTDIDGYLEVGTKVGPFTVVAAAGKSPGEVALHWPERRTLIVGDAVIGNPPGRCSLLREKVMDDPPRLRRSIAALLNLDFDVLLVGDGISILADARRRVAELVEGASATPASRPRSPPTQDR